MEWSEQPERTPPARRFPLGSAEDDCLGLLMQLNAQADQAWMALYEGRTEDAAREVATLIGMATRCGARLQERE